MSLYTDETNVEHIYIGLHNHKQDSTSTLYKYGIPPLSWMDVVMWQAVYNCICKFACT